MFQQTTFPGFRRRKQVKGGKPAVDNDGLSLLESFKTDEGLDEDGVPTGVNDGIVDKPVGKYDSRPREFLGQDK